MKKLVLISSFAILNFVFQSTIKAQDNSNEIIALLDSIKNTYNGLPDYNFNYQVKPPEEKHTEEMTSYKLDREKNCDEECICNSYVSYKGPDKSYLELFYLSALKGSEFRIIGDTLFLQKNGSQGLKPMTMSHTDPVKLIRIRSWLEKLTGYCESYPLKE